MIRTLALKRSGAACYVLLGVLLVAVFSSGSSSAAPKAEATDLPSSESCCLCAYDAEREEAACSLLDSASCSSDRRCTLSPYGGCVSKARNECYGHTKSCDVVKTVAFRRFINGFPDQDYVKACREGRSTADFETEGIDTFKGKACNSMKIYQVGHSGPKHVNAMKCLTQLALDSKPSAPVIEVWNSGCSTFSDRDSVEEALGDLKTCLENRKTDVRVQFRANQACAFFDYKKVYPVTGSFTDLTFEIDARDVRMVAAKSCSEIRGQICLEREEGKKIECRDNSASKVEVEMGTVTCECSGLFVSTCAWR